VHVGERAARWLTFVYFFVAPGITAVLIPWLLSGWETVWQNPHWAALAGGWVLAIAGFVPVADAFVRFARAHGTPIPLAPPPRLVVDGFNRWVRNPMYLGVTVSVAGQTLALGSWVLAAYCAVFWIVMASFVRFYEEPSLRKRFGKEYLDYQEAVPAWLPRVRGRTERNRT
jgi:protein-S-isoprenylcysteine O-methyltransferase Ste14